MKIKTVGEETIVFEDGSWITYDHDQDCCENNYADFSQLDDEAINYDFEEIDFEPIEGSGFRFGDERRKFFIPCYSEQNGYYSSDIVIFYNGEQVLFFECEERIY